MTQYDELIAYTRETYLLAATGELLQWDQESTAAGVTRMDAMSAPIHPSIIRIWCVVQRLDLPGQAR